MAWLVTIRPAYEAVYLPNGKVYEPGETGYLTETQYAQLKPATRRTFSRAVQVPDSVDGDNAGFVTVSQFQAAISALMGNMSGLIQDRLGRDGGSAKYVHTQSVPASTWDITHSLGVRIAPTCYLDDDTEPTTTDFEYVSSNRLYVMWGQPMSGQAYF